MLSYYINNIFVLKKKTIFHIQINFQPKLWNTNICYT